MFKRISSSAAFSAFIFAMIGLFPVIATAQAPSEPQQGAINTTRSNIKNTSRTTGEVMVVLNEVSGKNVASRWLKDANKDGNLSGAESEFDFGVVPKGDYVLTLRSLQGQVSGLNADLTVLVIINGAVGGKVVKNWNLKTNKVSDVSPADTQRLGLRIDGLDGKLDNTVSQMNERTKAGSPSEIPLKADGKTSIEGKITPPNGGIVIQNIGKPN